jgi:NAD-dependent SIR2 family protein deacetylase
MSHLRYMACQCLACGKITEYLMKKNSPEQVYCPNCYSTEMSVLFQQGTADYKEALSDSKV